MAGRIRSIKPEWLENQRLCECSDEARLLSAALLLLADDHGNGRASPMYIAGHVWTYSRDPRESLAKASRAVSELVATGFIRLYEVDGQDYFTIPGWLTHQRVDKPGKPRVPGPDSPRARESLAKVPESLAPDHEHRSVGSPSVGTQEQGRESEGNPGSRTARQRVEPHPDASDVAERLRDLLLANKPDHALSSETVWRPKRPAWIRHLSATFRTHARDPGRAREILEWVFGDQGGADFRFVVESPKALREKWDRIEQAMAQRKRQGSSPRMPDRAAELWAYADRLEAEETP